MDFLGQDQKITGESKDTTQDYLGRPAPIAFKNQPALPGAGGGSIGVGAGPATTSAGIGVSGVRGQQFADFLSAFAGSNPSGGGDGVSGGEAAAAGATSEGGNISGFDATTANIGANVASTALGVPGIVGILSSILGAAPAVAQGVPGLATAGVGGAKGLGSLLSALGLAPESNITMQTAQGPVGLAPTYSGFFSALANAIMGNPNFAAIDPSTMQTMPAPPNTSSINSSITGLAPGQASLFGAPGLSTTSVFGADPATAFALANNRGSEGLTGPPGDDGSGPGGPGPGVSGEGGPGSGTGVASGDTTE